MEGFNQIPFCDSHIYEITSSEFKSNIIQALTDLKINITYKQPKNLPQNIIDNLITKDRCLFLFDKNQESSSKNQESSRHPKNENQESGRYLLCMTTVGTNSYSILISRHKNPKMYVSRHRFVQDVYNTTVLEGILKKTNGRWEFFITDMMYYKGDPIYKGLLLKRLSYTLKLLHEDVYIPDPTIEVFSLNVYNYADKTTATNDHMIAIPFKYGNDAFKLLEPINNSQNVKPVYVKSNEGTSRDFSKPSRIPIHIPENKPIIPEHDSIKEPSSKPKIVLKIVNKLTPLQVVRETESPLKTPEKQFLIVKTDLPDVYYLKDPTNTKSEIVYAHIPTIACSRFTKKLFSRGEKEVLHICTSIDGNWMPKH